MCRHGEHDLAIPRARHEPATVRDTSHNFHWEARTDRLLRELDTLRAENQTVQQESASAASQTAAMMSLNLKLQSSASKNQAKTIELELKGHEAREARELLSIVQVG